MLGIRCANPLHFRRLVRLPLSVWQTGQHQYRPIRGDVCVMRKICITAYYLLIAPLLGREYANADFRWGIADETVVSLELLTVFGAGPLCCYILYQLVRQDAARHYWIVVLSTAELYGGWQVTCLALQPHAHSFLSSG